MIKVLVSLLLLSGASLLHAQTRTIEPERVIADGTGNYFTTFCDRSQEYTVDESTKAYIGCLDSNNQLNLIPITSGIIPKEEAVLLWSKSAEIVLTKSSFGAEKDNRNNFMGDNEDWESSPPYNYGYVLSAGHLGISFYEDRNLYARTAFLFFEERIEDIDGGIPMVFTGDEVPEVHFYDTQKNVIDFTCLGDIIIHRSMGDDGWYSLCLPFEVDKDQTAAMFSQVASYDKLVGDTYKFRTENEIAAGIAYIVKVDKPMTELHFTDVYSWPIDPDNNRYFQGVFNPTELKADDRVIGSGYTVNPLDKAGTIKGFRAYFPASATKARFFTVDDGELNSLDAIDRDDEPHFENGIIYDFYGRRVSVPQQRGIYIVNGKRVYNK